MRRWGMKLVRMRKRIIREAVIQEPDAEQPSVNCVAWERASKSGLGIYAVRLGRLEMAAVVVVNALGDIFDPENGKKIAGLRSEDGSGFADTREELYKLSKRTDYVLPVIQQLAL